METKTRERASKLGASFPYDNEFSFALLSQGKLVDTTANSAEEVNYHGTASFENFQVLFLNLASVIKGEGK